MDIGNSFQQALDKFIGFLPNLLGCLVVLIVGFVIAKLLAAVVRKVLVKVGIDRRMHDSNANKYVGSVMPSPARAIGGVVFWLVFVFAIFAAIGVLKIPALTTFMNQVLAYLPNVIAAILIFVVAAVLATAIAGAVNRFMGDTPTGKVAGTVLPALVMVIALFMILQQLKIAEQIVVIAFAATMGALALALALAFGLGGRPVAQRMLDDAYRKGQEQRDQIRSDMQTARERAEAANADDTSVDSDEYGHHSRGEHAASTTGAEPSGSTLGAPGPQRYAESGTTYPPPSSGSPTTRGFDQPGEPPTRHG